MLRIGIVAKELNTTIHIIRNMAKSGKLDFFLTPGGDMRFDLEEARKAFKKREKR